MSEVGEAVDDVIRFHALQMLAALIGSEKDGLDPQASGAEDVTIHVVTHEKDLFRPCADPIQRGLKKAWIRFAEAVVTR